MRRLTLKNIGPIKSADLTFGDLTVLVGPQATGKSIALQFLKLLVDRGQVLQQLGRYGIDWEGDAGAFLDAYFGEGMRAIWSKSSRVEEDGDPVEIGNLIRKTKPKDDEHAFLIPAQRVLALRNGWPRPFTDYAAGDPFAVRDFSEKLRILVEQEFIGKAMLFPQERRLKSETREMLALHVFGGFGLRVDKLASQKRLVLSEPGSAKPLPYMVWSAGQREFVPLLLGLYWLMPPTNAPRRGKIDWVMLEEIEMGLHPRAINVVLLMVLELVTRGYKVCLSTHSPQVLEALWAIARLREAGADPKLLLAVFKAETSPSMQKLAKQVFEKSLKVHYFDRDQGRTTDISSLDAASESGATADWGGLAEFSTTANEAVARASAAAARSK